MIELLALKIIGAVAGVAAISVASFTLIPVPAQPYGIWIDSPGDGSTIEEGPVTFNLHSDLPDLTGMQVVLRLDGASVATLTDTTLDLTSRGKDATTLSWFSQDWNAIAGVYQVQLNTCTQNGACWQTQRTTTLTVLPQAGVLVDTAEGTTAPQPTATPADTPTPSDTPAPSPSVPTAPAPSPTVAPPVYEMPYGFIRQTLNDPTKLSSYFTIRAATPQQAVGSVQVQVVAAGLSPNEAAWQSIPCTGALTSDPEYTAAFTCSTGNYVVAPGDGTPRTGYYRLVLTNGDKTYTGSLQYWSIIR